MKSSHLKNQIPNNHLDDFRFEMLNLAFHQFPNFLLGSTVLAFGVIFLPWDKASHTYIISWSLFIVIFLLISAYGIFKAQKIQIQSDNFTTLHTILQVAAITYGLIWGMLLLFINGINSPDYIFLLPLVLLLIITQMAFITALEKRVFYFSTIPIITLLVLVNLLSQNLILAVICSAYYIICSVFFTNAHSNLKISIENKYKNEKFTKLIDMPIEGTKNSNNSRFLAAASHDLRQPIHAQTLLIEELIERINDPDLLHLIRDLKISSNALHDLFDAIMDISKLDSDKIKPQFKVFPLHELMDTIALEFKSFASEKKLRFEIISPRVNIKSDKNLLMRIIQNLVSNAIKYTLKGSVLVTTKIKNEFIRIEVRDTGVGISKSQHAAIFQEFYQIPNPETENTNSLGIGLSIVKKLSILLNHEIEVFSEPGKGSIFAIIVPIINTESTTDTSRLRISCDLDSFNGSRVLIIDDDNLVLRSMQSLLTHWGCNVTTVRSGKEACELILPETPKPDIIIADYKLQRGETGIQAVKLLKRMLNIAAPTIIITGDTSETTKYEIKRNRYKLLLKPIVPAKLRSLIRFLVDESKIEHK